MSVTLTFRGGADGGAVTKFRANSGQKKQGAAGITAAARGDPRRFSPRLRPPIEKVERALSLQLAGGLVLDGVPPFVGGLDIASNVLIPAFGYRGREVE
jgi:hypothetical protein